MTTNNESRVLFSKFLEKYKDIVFRVDNRNVFSFHSFPGKFAFSVVDKPVIECRQFYEDLDGLLCVNRNTGCGFEILKSNLLIDKTPNRVMTNGIKAFSASADTSSGTLSKLKVPV